MSRIGKLPIKLPKGVEISISDDNVLTVKGPLGQLTQQVNPIITMNVEDGELHFSRPSDSKEHKAMHGLYRALAANMVKGVSEGFKVVQEVIGVGYKVQANGQVMEMDLGSDEWAQVDEEGKVDYKKLNNIQNVIADQPLAQKIPAERGKDVQTVIRDAENTDHRTDRRGI